MNAAEIIAEHYKEVGSASLTMLLQASQSWHEREPERQFRFGQTQAYMKGSEWPDAYRARLRRLPYFLFRLRRGEK